MTDPMTLDTLGAIYREELKAAGLTRVPEDLYVQMDDVVGTLRRAWTDWMERDDESLMAEGAKTAYTTARRISADIRRLRMRKILRQSVDGIPDDLLTPQEATLRDSVREAVAAFEVAVQGGRA